MVKVPPKADTEVSGTTPEEHKPAHDVSDKRPIWHRQLNRVQCSMWKQDQNGKAHYSITFFRQYQDKRNSEWKRVHSFSELDLDDMRLLVNEAAMQVRSINQLEQRMSEPD